MMNIYSIIIEAYETEGLVFFQNYHVTATDARHAIDILFSDERLKDIVQVDVDELLKIDAATENNIQVIEVSGRSYYNPEED